MSAQVSYKKQITFFLILSVLLLFAVEIGVRIIETPYEPCTFIGKDALKNAEKIARPDSFRCSDRRFPKKNGSVKGIGISKENKIDFV